MIMNKHFTAFNELTSNAGNYLELELGYALKTSHSYRRIWRQVREFMFASGMTHYDESVEKQFLRFKFQDKNRQDLTVNQRVTYNGLKMLTEFDNTGKISVPARLSKYPLEFKGLIGNIIVKFLHDKKQTNPSRSTFHNYQRNLFDLMKYCECQGISSVEHIDLATLLNFINQCDSTKKTVIILTISAIRAFMQYLFDQNHIAIDYSEKIPRYKAVQQPKIPSTYSKEEVKKLIASIDRTSAIGKRNYVIIIIASRLGLRASDISRLKFEYMNWNTNTIEMPQFKTGKQLILPLLTDVGNAIIDYLKYGRPESKEPYVLLIKCGLIPRPFGSETNMFAEQTPFNTPMALPRGSLSARPPYGRFTTSNIVTHVVQRAMINAGIDIKNRKFGPHALRHSLGFRMLEKSTALPVISEVLGHQSSESTRYYLRIDLTSMQQCMLDVPLVATDFYMQRGGKFYG